MELQQREIRPRFFTQSFEDNKKGCSTKKDVRGIKDPQKHKENMENWIASRVTHFKD